MKVIHAFVKEISEVIEYTKAQVMPFCGWPNGVDPYPNVGIDEVVMRVKTELGYEANGTAIDKQPASAGTEIEIESKKFIITDCVNKFENDLIEIDFTATFRPPQSLLYGH